MSDHLERVKAWLTRDTVNSPARDRLCASYETEPLNRSDLRALVAEVERLRADNAEATGRYEAAVEQIDQLRAVWNEHLREVGAIPQRPERGGEVG